MDLNGVPNDCDWFDVRLYKSYYIDTLKPLTGNDKKVSNYVMSFMRVLFSIKTCGYVYFLIPNYIKEGKNQLVIGIGWHRVTARLHCKSFV